MTYAIPIAVGVLLLIAGATIVCLLIDGRHERAGARLFRAVEPAAAPPAGLPEPAPFPGDVPFVAAPVAEPEPAAVDDSSIWDRHGIARDQIWALLKAEVTP